MDEEKCALCEKRAMMRCDSDQAKLCWDCDEKVHSANFLVAKHSRILLCRLCQSLTPWKASGTKLTPTVSFCHRCVADRHVTYEHVMNHDPHQVDDDDDDDDAEYSFGDVYDDDEYDGGSYDEEEEEEEGENQVVPMSSVSASASASSPDSDSGFALKRSRDNSNFSVDSHDETASSSSEMLSASLPSSDGSSISMSNFEPFNKRRINQGNY